MKESICSKRGSVYSFLLTALKSGDKYAYEIGKAVKEISDGKYVLKEASLYSGLKRLEAQGFLTSYIKEQENGLTRRYYKLTQSGHEKLDNINFSWDNAQKETIAKVFCENKTTPTLPENTKGGNKINTNSVSVNEKTDQNLNSITISGEDDTLEKHYIHENQQDLFNIINNIGKTGEDNISALKPEKEDEQPLAQEPTKNEFKNENLKIGASSDTISSHNTNVNEFEFYNLKNNLKPQSTSFLDKINSEEVKQFNYESKKVEKSETALPKNEKFEIEKTIEAKENVVNESKIDISDIFGDLCIKNESIEEVNTNLENKVCEPILKNDENVGLDNVNCTLEVPIKHEETSKSEEDDVLFSTKPTDEILNQKEKNLNELFETKQVKKASSITMNNSVQYANNKIDFDKPSFDTSYNKTKNDLYEIRYYTPIEQKHVKSTYYNINKLNMFSGLGTLLLGVLFILGVYFLLDKTPLKSLSVLQIVLYISALSLVVLYSLIKTLLYFVNKFKMVKSIDIRSNILFKLLFALCVLSTLLITYKFYDLNILQGYSYLLVLPSSLILNFLLEEVIKICIAKYTKS